MSSMLLWLTCTEGWHSCYLKKLNHLLLHVPALPADSDETVSKWSCACLVHNLAITQLSITENMCDILPRQFHVSGGVWSLQSQETGAFSHELHQIPLQPVKVSGLWIHLEKKTDFIMAYRFERIIIRTFCSCWIVFFQTAIKSSPTRLCAVFY